MSKLLTVIQLRNELQKLIDEGHGFAPTLLAGGVPAKPRLRDGTLTYVGPSEWDNVLYVLNSAEPGKVVFL